MNAIIFLVGVLLLTWGGLVQAQQQEEVLPYELRHVHNHCGNTAFFVNVRVEVRREGGGQVVTDFISCLSKKDDRLVTIVCQLATEKCEVSRKRDANTPEIERLLREFQQARPQPNKI